MQDDDDAEARRKRADRLRAQIERVKRGGGDAAGKSSEATSGEAPASPSPDDAQGAARPDVHRSDSPRDFVERRMRELDNRAGKKPHGGKPTKT